jgi:hypothetical protein
VDNLKLRGEIAEDSKFEFKLLKGITFVPKGSYVLKCEHGREWLVKDITDVRV